MKEPITNWSLSLRRAKVKCKKCESRWREKSKRKNSRSLHLKIKLHNYNSKWWMQRSLEQQRLYLCSNLIIVEVECTISRSFIQLWITLCKQRWWVFIRRCQIINLLAPLIFWDIKDQEVKSNTNNKLSIVINKNRSNKTTILVISQGGLLVQT